MHLLPSEQDGAVAKALAKFNKTGSLYIAEPCNCGSHIRHNNGGNYHELISLRKDSERVFLKQDSTCELDPPAEWEEIDQMRAKEIIQENADWL